MNERYAVVRELGKSPYAHTHLVTEKATGRECVVKSLDAGQTADLKVIELFRREVRVLGNLEHDGIPRLLDFYDEKSSSGLTLNLVQEFVPGRNLEDVVSPDAPLPEPRVIHIARQLLGVLRYIHRFSPPVIHRDIKPSNVVLSDDDEVHLIDFSGARDQMMQDREPGGGGFTIVGTYGYMPYEQYEGRALPASDIYSAGMTMLFLLSGMEPMDLDRDGMRSVVPGNLDISTGMRKFIERMIEPDWKERFQSAEEALASLDRLEERTRPMSSSRTIAVVVASVVAAVLSFVALRDDPSPVPAEPPAIALDAPPASPKPDVAKRLSEPVPPEQGPPIAEDASPDLVVTLLWARRPLQEVWTEPPSFSVWSKTKGEQENASFRYENGVVEVFGLSAGKAYINATVIQADFSYQGSVEFVVNPATPSTFELNMERSIRITGPAPVFAESECDNVVPSPVRFDWEAIGDGVRFDYEVLEGPCGSGSTDRKTRTVVHSGNTSRNTIALDLPPTPEERVYSLSVTARLRGIRVGQGGTNFRAGSARTP